MKKIMLKSLLIPLSVALLTGCYGVGTAKSGDTKYGGDGGHATDYGYTSGDEMEPEGGEGENGEPEQLIPAGQLTCSALDDNKYYDFWQEITGKNQEPGIFNNYRENFGSSFNTFNRVKLTITNGNDVYVSLKENNTTFHVDNMHNAYLFPTTNNEMHEVTISYLNKDGERVSFDTMVKDNDEIDLENEFTLSKKLEIMFVIDATGSMGDEMKYIQAEIDDVIGKVKEENPGSTISLAMMVYRDHKDDYVTRYSDFTEDIAAQQSFLMKIRICSHTG